MRIGVLGAFRAMFIAGFEVGLADEDLEKAEDHLTKGDLAACADEVEREEWARGAGESKRGSEQVEEKRS